jgi:hypothetical protein
MYYSDYLDYIEKNDLKPVIENKFTITRLRKGSRDVF